MENKIRKWQWERESADSLPSDTGSSDSKGESLEEKFNKLDKVDESKLLNENDKKKLKELKVIKELATNFDIDNSKSNFIKKGEDDKADLNPESVQQTKFQSRGKLRPEDAFLEKLYDPLNYLTNEMILGRYKSLAQREFYNMIMRIGLFSSKEFTVANTDVETYNMNKLLARRISKAPPSHCKDFLVKEDIFLLLDNSGSCAIISQEMNTVAEIVEKRHDIKTFWSNDIHTNFQKAHPSQGFLRTNKYDKRDKKDMLDGYSTYPLNKFTGKKVIILSDSDGYPAIKNLLAVGVKHIYFFDFYNYLRYLRYDDIPYDNVPFEGRKVLSGSSCIYNFKQYDHYIESWKAYGLKMPFWNIKKRGFIPYYLKGNKLSWYLTYDLKALITACYNIKK